jgi:hypothetical protein
LCNVRFACAALHNDRPDLLGMVASFPWDAQLAREVHTALA